MCKIQTEAVILKTVTLHPTHCADVGKLSMQMLVWFRLLHNAPQGLRFYISLWLLCCMISVQSEWEASSSNVATLNMIHQHLELWVSFCASSTHTGEGQWGKCFSCVLRNCSHVGCQAIGQLTHGYTLFTNTHTHTHTEEIQSLKCDRVTLTRTLRFLLFLPHSSPVFLSSSPPPSSLCTLHHWSAARLLPFWEVSRNIVTWDTGQHELITFVF